MTTLRTVFLACLALTPLATQAQTQAPAEDRPGRVVLVPMTVQWPAGEGWVILPHAETSVTFLRQVGKERNSGIASVSGKVPDKRIVSADDLIGRVRDFLKEMLAPKLYEVLSEDIHPETNQGNKCVRSFSHARDLGALDKEKEPLHIMLHGQFCLHPSDEGIVVSATLSERAPAGKANVNLENEAKAFFKGVRTHMPLKGKDWQPFAEQGDANAQVWLARTLLQTNELEEATVWLGRAADKGHVDAQALLGLAYLTGRAVTRSPEDALKWLRMAAEKGYPKAEGLLGWALITAAEVRNEEEGRRWVRKAAADGDSLGQALLGELFLFGRAGMEKNEVEGVAWTRKASEQGDARARYELGRLLANGIGVAKDPGQARFWLELAAAQGNPDARKVLGQERRASKPAPAESK